MREDPGFRRRMNERSAPEGHGRMRSEGPHDWRTAPPVKRRAQAAVLATLVALAFITGLGVALPGSRPARAQAAAAALGVDVDPANNTASSLAGVQGCVEVAVGDQFPVDIFARDVQKLAAWEVRFAFDHQVVQIINHQYAMFLLSTAPQGSIFPSLFERETDDRYFLAAAEFGGTPDTGSGVLARITMQAVAPGRSPAHIVAEPGYMAPYLTTSAGAGLFSGPVVGGEIAVGQPCSGTEPLEPAPKPSTGPGSAPAPGSGRPLVIEEGNSGAIPVSTQGAGAPGAQAPEPSASGGLAAAIQPTGGALHAADSPDGATPAAGREESAGFPWWLVASLLGAVLVAGTGSALAFMFRNRS